MKKKKLMAGTALLMTAAITMQSVNWSGLNVFAQGENFADTKVLQLSFENNVNDSTGKHSVTVNTGGNAVYSDGVNNTKALSLNGATYLDLGTDGDLQPSKMTVSFWLKAPENMSGENLIMWNKQDGCWYADGWYMAIQNDRALEISLGGSAQKEGQPYKAYVSTSSAAFFPAGEWVHVAVVYDSETKAAEIYRNGVIQSVSYDFTAEDGLIEATDSGKWLGCNSPAYGGKSTFEIDEYELYSSCATQEEVEELYTKNGGVIDSGEEDTDTSEYISGLSAYDLGSVSVTDEYLTNAQEKDIAYLLSLDSDRLLAGFRETAGLDMKGAARYDGWENSLIGGHTMGHYLTAMAQAVAELPDSDARKAQIETKLNYIIDGLYECQNALGTGYIFGATLPDKSNPEKQFDNVEKGLTNIGTQSWVPWYTMHKILAGLVDTYKYTGNETALATAEGLGDWVYDRATGWDTATRNRVLGIEYGGMNDCLYELYAVSGNDKYAVAAHVFDEDSLFKAVAAGGANVLNNRHANTTIPKFLGALNRYVTTDGQTVNGEVVDASAYLEYAEKFFDMVLERHTYITGDNSEWEHFGADHVLDAERTNCNCETCNAYNMLKLAKALYMVTGDEKYSNYYENTFYNTILSSQNPETGMTTYFQPMASGYFKVYGTETKSFWCCTGSGMENFTKLGNAMYFHTDDMVIVNQYFSSVLTDEEKNIEITQTADIPSSDMVEFTVNTLDGTTDIQTKTAFRLPSWLAGDAVITVNGEEVNAEVKSGYAILDGLKDGDVIQVTLPMELKAYNLPDGESVYAFKYGPVVLSAELGSTNMVSTTTGVSVTIPASKLIEEEYISDGTENISVLTGSVADFMANINENLVKTDGELEWTLDNTDANLTFVPHYTQHTQRYGIYFNYQTNTGAFNVAKYIKDKAQERFDNAKLDTVQPGYGQYENDEEHNMQESNSVGNTSDGTSRYAKAGGYFSYTMKTAPNEENVLQATFRKADNGKSIKISVDGTVVYNEVLAYEGDETEYTVRIPVLADVIGNKTSASVKFESGKEGEDSAAIYNFLYTTKAYSADTSLELTASEGTLTQDGANYAIKVGKDVTSIDLTAELASKYGYLRINGSVVKETVPYTVDLSSSNFATLTYTVYAEDHETTQDYTVKIAKDVDTANRENVDKSLAYFVNCGDYDVTTLSEGDLFGIYNGVTDQAYGTDPVTGYRWGISDTISNPLKNGSVTNNPAMTNAVFTDNTWTFETNASVTDASAKTETNRYTKNQFETGIPRNLNYDFELPNGEYTMELYFADPWGCSKNAIVSAEGQKLMENTAVNQAVTTKVDVTDGTLNLNITAPETTLCLNLAYIKIFKPEAEVPTTPETTVPEETTVQEETTVPGETTTGKQQSTDGNTQTGDKAPIAPLAAAAAVSLGVIAVSLKKRKNQ